MRLASAGSLKAETVPCMLSRLRVSLGVCSFCAVQARYEDIRHSHYMSERTDLNMTRRLTRMIRLSGLPLAGPAHQLRKRFVQATHALCVLQRSCTHGRIVMAMRDLLEGWADTEEEHYQHRLLNVNAVDADSGASAPTRAHAVVQLSAEEFTLCGTA